MGKQEKTQEMRSDVKAFIENAGGEAKKTLLALNTAGNITDKEGIKILVKRLKYSQKNAAQFIETLHFADFHVDSNDDQWYLKLYD